MYAIAIRDFDSPVSVTTINPDEGELRVWEEREDVEEINQLVREGLDALGIDMYLGTGICWDWYETTNLYSMAFINPETGHTFRFDFINLDAINSDN